MERYNLDLSSTYKIKKIFLKLHEFTKKLNSCKFINCYKNENLIAEMYGLKLSLKIIIRSRFPIELIEEYLYLYRFANHIDFIVSLFLKTIT